MDLKELRNIPNSFSLAKKGIVFSFLLSIIVLFSCLVWTIYVIGKYSETIYIVTENGQAVAARSVSSNEVDNYRLPEIKNHVKVFHKLFWEYDQFSYERRVDEALYLIGESGKDLYLTLKANGHFSRIQSENLVQKMNIDSLIIDDKVIPYRAIVYGKIKITRTDQKATQTNSFSSNFQIYNVSRTEQNPHGLLIENYTVRNENLE